MNTASHQFYFLLALLAVIFVLVFFIFRPFLYTLFLAATFAVVLFPLQKKVRVFLGGRKGISAFITTLIVAVFIVTPLALLGLHVFEEAGQLYSLLSQNQAHIVLDIAKKIIDQLRSILPINIEPPSEVDQYINQGLAWIIQHLGAFFSSIAQLALHGFIFVVSFYYLLKDGDIFVKNIVAASPLTDTDDELILKKLHRATNAVVKGSLFVAVIQGALAGIGFAIFGVQSPIFWGSVAALSAIIPAVGTSLVVIPAVIFLFLTSGVPQAIGLLVWGTVLVGLVDNLLKPKLVERGTQIHPLLILLSVFGGIGFFGPIGFLLGPLVVSLFAALLEAYVSLVRNTHGAGYGKINI